MQLTTRLFPILAIIASVLAYYQSTFFAGLQSTIVPLLTLIMFTMGLTLKLSDFRSLLKRPSVLVTGTLLQFILMPLLAWLLAKGFSLSNELMTGLILVGCCPGGTASNVVCFLAKGNLAMSVMLTLVSTLLSVVATPLLTWLYIGQAIEVPILDMMQSIMQIVLLPVVLGLLVNTYLEKYLRPLTPVFPVISVLAIVLIIAIVVALNKHNLPLLGFGLILAVTLHNLLGLSSAYGISKLLRYDESTCRTIAIEVGMQNSGLSVALATQFYSSAAALPGALFSLWHNLSGALLAALWGSRKPE